jgi:hypothetical protein
MLGTFQSSRLRIEVDATAQQLTHVLLGTVHIRRWLWPQYIEGALPPELHPGLTFTSYLGGIPVAHEVAIVEANALRFILSRAIDGFHEWHWGDGWIEVQLEGVSLLPLHLGQKATLLRLQTYLRWYRHQTSFS